MKIKKTLSEKVVLLIITILLTFIALITLYPFWNTLVMSISSASSAMASSIKWVPTEISFDSWKIVLNSKYVWQGMWNTVYKTVLGTGISVFAVVALAYPLSKKDFIGRNFFTKLLIFTMMFNGGMIPSFLLVKNLNLMDTVFALVLPGAVSAFNVIILRNFFESIPKSLEEAAKIDGANDIYILGKIILPLSLPALATVTLWIVVGHWNAWFDSVLYISDRSRMVIQVVLREMILTDKIDSSMNVSEVNIVPPSDVMKATITMFVTLPVLLVYPFIQKYFTKGIMIGSIKE